MTYAVDLMLSGIGADEKSPKGPLNLCNDAAVENN